MRHRRTIALCGMLLALLRSSSSFAAQELTAAWAPPHGYAVVWRGPAPEGACVIQTQPVEVVLGCGQETTFILRAEDGTVGGEVFELRDGAVVLASATLGGRVALPDVSAP